MNLGLCIGCFWDLKKKKDYNFFPLLSVMYAGIDTISVFRSTLWRNVGFLWASSYGMQSAL